MSEITTETLTVRDVELTLRRAGEGETLLLLHGANGSMSWLPVFEALAENYHVILPDHPGFGDTVAPGWMDNISDVSYFYLDVIEALGLDQFHLAGHSMGGWIAAEIGVRDAHRIKSLTLISAAGIRVDGTPMGDLFAWSPEETVGHVFAQKSFRDQALAMEPNEAQIEVMLRNRQMAARLCWTPRLHNPDLRKWLHRLDLPTLILWGDSDGIFPEPYAHAYHELIPGSELEVYENCGHVPMAEARDAFLGRLQAFTQGAA
ncbi:MAG: alpha/beta hydrolase [Rhodospirillaceae bacterium]|nr:alpha/beta hydrolase [Rhodospirillaceae bacterium]